MTFDGATAMILGRRCLRGYELLSQNRPFRREVRRFFAEGAPGELGLRNIIQLYERKHGFVFRADSTAGPVALKFWAGTRAHLSRRFIAAHALLKEYGFGPPQLHYSSISKEAVERHGVACVAMDFISIPDPSGDLDAFSVSAFETLGKLHNISNESAVEALAPCDGGSVWNRPTAAMIMRKTRKSLRFLMRVGGLSPASAKIVAGIIGDAARELKSNNRFETFVHTDYQGGNVIPRPGANALLLDLDMVSVGPPCWDVGYAAGAIVCPRIPEQFIAEAGEAAQRLFPPSRLDAALSAYSAAAPEAAAPLWERHGRAALLWGYLCRLRAFANQASKPGPVSMAKRKSMLRAARAGCENLSRHVEVRGM